MKTMIELCSGSGIMSKTFKEHDYKTITIDNNPTLNPDLCLDVSKLQLCDLPDKIDVIWFSPPCTSYSIAGIRYHRVKVGEELRPISNMSFETDNMIKHIIYKISEIMETNPNLIWFIENPRGGLRKMDFMQNIGERYTVTYCQYGDIRMKPTDIWSNLKGLPFKPMCHNGDSCHESAPRGSKNGTQGLKNAFERGKIPIQLCEEIRRFSE